MKYILMVSALLLSQMLASQEIVQLPYEPVPELEWNNQEKSFYSEDWDNPVVTNVSIPTMEIFRPEKPNGTAVVIAPGGGLYALSIESEGTKVAEWLAENGITAFVLKYRLVPTGDDGVKDLATDGSELVRKKASELLPYSVQDALNAIEYVRENAGDFGIKENKIGIVGFSAGGAVVMGVGYSYSEKSRPDFLVPVYAWTLVFDVLPAPSDAPPMFVICSSDDPLGLAPGSIELYNAWLKEDKSVALNMYAKGGHGYGMKKQGLPSDRWIERFHEWLKAQNLVEN